MQEKSNAKRKSENCDVCVQSIPFLSHDPARVIWRANDCQDPRHECIVTTNRKKSSIWSRRLGHDCDLLSGTRALKIDCPRSEIRLTYQKMFSRWSPESRISWRGHGKLTKKGGSGVSGLRSQRWCFTFQVATSTSIFYRISRNYY